MKYLSIDIETTGLDPERDQILSIGIIVEDTTKKLPFNEIPKFHCAIVHKEIRGGLFAINLNRDLIQVINSWTCAEDSDEQKAIEEDTGMIFLKEEEVTKHLFRFLYLHNMLDKTIYAFESGGCFKVINGVSYPSITSRTAKSNLNVAGKNFGTFDKLFIEKLPWWDKLFKIRQRIIDPAVLFTDWTEDESLPNLTVCKKRAKIGEIVTHDAIEDAWDVIELMRTQY